METSNPCFNKASRGFYRRLEFETIVLNVPVSEAKACGTRSMPFYTLILHPQIHTHLTVRCCARAQSLHPHLPNPSERLCPWPQTAHARGLSPHGSEAAAGSGAPRHLMPGSPTCFNQETQKREPAVGG